jgi:hypothetical protein
MMVLPLYFADTIIPAESVAGQGTGFVPLAK